MRKFFCSAVFLLGVGALQGVETVTNPVRSDGFGAQFQTIIYSAIYAEMNSKKFVYTPFKSMEHNYDNDKEFLRKKEWLINFKNHFESNSDAALQSKIKVKEYIQFFEQNLSKCANSKSLKKIKEIFRENKRREDYFSDAHFHIALHIRRVNAHDMRDSGKAISDREYLKIINTLRADYFFKKPLFHIYSQGDLRAFKKRFGAKDVLLHINESIEDTFTSMVFADLLVTSVSSLSYTAALLSDGEIYYIPFWHPPLPHWKRI